MESYINTKSVKISLAVDDCFDAVSNENMLASLCSGFTGISWMANNINARFDSFFDEDPTESIDHYIYKSCLISIKNNNWDFLHGGGGQLLYLLTKYESTKIEVLKFYLTEIVTELLIKKEKHNDTFTVWKPLAIETQVDFGMAHGLLSLLSIFRLSAKLNIEKNKCLEAIQQLFICYNKNYDSIKQVPYKIPTLIENNKKKMPYRLGWCYGDTIVGLTFLKIGVELSLDELKKFGISILEFHSDNFEIEKNKVNELGLCHGTFGIALIYKEAFNICSNSHFNKSYLTWYEKGIEDLLVNFKEGNYTCGVKNLHVANMSFLDGLSGIGLVVHDYLQSPNHTTKHDWKKLLLI